MTYDEVIKLDEDVHININNKDKIATLKVDQWETLVQYDKARGITKDSPDVVRLRKIINELY